ncbi:MAG: LacI family transcriptional regulator [Treponema sp.]|jgi:DNA-binding LacI/PurR family transcriptional regulator|nr:LacI family transcriptional regulator [Treponema sp.]
MATIKDVASAVGVSVSTVSYALNGTRPISKAKKELILKTAQELRFRPRAIARSLASKRTHILAILFPALERGLGLSEIDLITQAARDALGRGYHMVIWTLQTDDEEELRELLAQELVDGIVLMEIRNRDWRIPVLKETDIPFIILGRDEAAPGESYIDVDFFDTMMRSISYLKGLGHRQIDFINQSEKSFRDGYGPVVRTHEAFEYFCGNFDIDGREYFCGWESEAVRSRTISLLSERQGTTACIVMNDKALPGIIAGLSGQRRRIPEDMSLVSIISSAGAASFFLPALTSFEMDIDAMMEAAISQLIAKIEGRYAELSTRLIPCILRERDSTGMNMVTRDRMVS